MGEWQPIESAPKDKTVVIIRLRGVRGEFPAFYNPAKAAWYAKGIPPGTKYPLVPIEWNPQ